MLEAQLSQILILLRFRQLLMRNMFSRPGLLAKKHIPCNHLYLNVNWYHQLVACKLVEYRSQKVHACIFPETTFNRKDLVPHDISDSCQFVVGAAFAEVKQVHDQLIRQRKILPCGVFLSPKFDSVMRIKHLCFAEEILFSWWQLVCAKPHLMNHFRDKFWPCFIFNWQEFVSLAEGKHFAERYLPLQNIFHALKHFLALQPCFCLFQLLLVYFVHMFNSDGGTLQNSHFSRHIPYTTMLLHKVEHSGLVNLASYHLEQGHQENQTIQEVIVMNVSQIKLRYVSKALYNKNSHVVYY